MGVQCVHIKSAIGTFIDPVRNSIRQLIFISISGHRGNIVTGNIKKVNIVAENIDLYAFRRKQTDEQYSVSHKANRKGEGTSKNLVHSKNGKGGGTPVPSFE